jgi:phosphoribosylanthranilate isomerase
MEPIVKICGINTPEALDAAIAAGADMIGLVRFGRSPRHLEVKEGRALSERARGKALRVALVVDADDAALAETVEGFDPDILQLHGSETPERVAAIRARFGRPVMKAVGIAEKKDLADLDAYAAVADRLLVDAKPPRTAGALPGGNGLSFDWRLIAGIDAGKPVMLSGGLDEANVAAAVTLTGVSAVDVSSGVERRPGEKDPDKIAAFVKAARAAFAASQNKDKVA